MPATVSVPIAHIKLLRELASMSLVLDDSTITAVPAGIDRDAVVRMFAELDQVEEMAILHGMEVGDTVRHKTGGPLMAVCFCDKEEVVCQWFDGADARQHSFTAAVLVRAEPFNTAC